MHQYEDATRTFRRALGIYKTAKQRNLLSKESAASVIGNILLGVERLSFDPESEEASEGAIIAELTDRLYDDLEDELAALAVEKPAYAPAIRKARPTR